MLLMKSKNQGIGSVKTENSENQEIEKPKDRKLKNIKIKKSKSRKIEKKAEILRNRGIKKSKLPKI